MPPFRGVTTVLIVVPLVGALALALAPLNRRAAEGLALMTTLVTLAFAIVELLRFDTNGGLQFVQDRVWIENLIFGADARYHVGMDGLSLFMVLLVAVGMLSAVSTAVWAERPHPRAYLGTMLVLEAALVLFFTAQDLVLAPPHGAHATTAEDSPEPIPTSYQPTLVLAHESPCVPSAMAHPSPVLIVNHRPVTSRTGAPQPAISRSARSEY